MTLPHSGFDKQLGLAITSASGDEVVASLVVGPDHLQPYGLVHGGVLCALVETVGSVGGALWFGDRGHVVGTANHTNFLRGVRDGTLTATATPIHRGRSQQLWNVDVTDEQGRLVAKGELRLANLTPGA
jgi:uncharacterized protein (TIGR00369 family)